MNQPELRQRRLLVSFNQQQVVVARQPRQRDLERERLGAPLKLLRRAAQHDGGPGAKKPVGVLTRPVHLEAMRVMFDHGNGKPTAHQARDRRLQQSGLPRTGVAADGQHRSGKLANAVLLRTHSELLCPVSMHLPKAGKSGPSDVCRQPLQDQG